MSGKTSKIGVHIKYGFTEFFRVSFDSSSKKIQVIVFCEDVFDMVLRQLDYPLLYDMVPYYHTDSYGDLVYQVYLKVHSIVC